MQLSDTTFDGELWANVFGYMSIACWFVVFTPQLYENYCRKNTDGVSVQFLLLWIFGDIFNLLGVVLEDLLVTMLLIAVYYLFSDVLLMGQTLYYRKFYKPAGDKVPGERDPLLPEESSSSSESRSTLVDVSARTRKTIRIFTALSLFLSTATLVGACLYFFGDPDNQVDLSQWHLVPQLLGWASALLYCCSRIPQIMQNFKTESVDGLSILMFIFSVTGNVTYCVSIFCKSIDRTYLLINFPWLLGSGGTLFFDFTIFFQFYLYRNRTECPEEDK